MCFDLPHTSCIITFNPNPQVTTMERVLTYHIMQSEHFSRYKLQACSLAAGREILGTTVILDLHGLSVGHFTLSVKRFLEKIARIDQVG